MPKTKRTAPIVQLRDHYRRNGYLRSTRQPDDADSHRGHELRFSALNARERDRIVRLLERLGIVSGKPFAKGSGHWRIAVYGKWQVETLLAWMDSA
jgi:hypothetical protein